MASSTSHFNSLEYRDASRSTEVIAASAIFMVMGILFVFLRQLSRHLQKASFMSADAFVPIGLLFLIAMCAVCTVAVTKGSVGRHTDVVYAYYPDTLALNFKIVFFVLPCLYCISVTMPKLAILSLYLHVFRDKWARWSCYGVGTVTVLTAVVNILTTIPQCKPLDQLWNPSLNGWCMDLGAHFQWGSFPNIFTDIAMLIIPVPMIKKLQVPLRIKIGVFATFLTGSIGLAASIARFASFNKSTAADPFWDSVPAIIWTIAEPGFYLIAACLVTLKPLLNYVIRESAIAPLFSSQTESLPLSPKSGEAKDVELHPMPALVMCSNRY